MSAFRSSAWISPAAWRPAREVPQQAVGAAWRDGRPSWTVEIRKLMAHVVGLRISELNACVPGAVELTKGGLDKLVASFPVETL